MFEVTSLKPANIVRRVIQVLTLPYSEPAKVTQFCIPSIHDTSKTQLVDHGLGTSVSQQRAQSKKVNIEPAIAMVSEMGSKLAELELESSNTGPSPGYVIPDKSELPSAELLYQKGYEVTKTDMFEVTSLKSTNIVKRVIQVLTLPYSGPAKVTRFHVPSMNDSSSSRLVDPDMDNPVVQQHAQSDKVNIEPAIAMVSEMGSKLAELELESSNTGPSPGYVIPDKIDLHASGLTLEKEETTLNLLLEVLPYQQSDPSDDQLIDVRRIRRSDLYSPYVPVEVNGYKTVFLLDTGATASILSKVHAIKLGILDGQCEPGKPKGKTATGSPISCYGKHEVNVKLGSENLLGLMEVADITENGFIGMDFLVAFGCVLDLNEMNLRMLQQSIPLVNSSGDRLACACYSARSVTIEAYSERVIPMYAHTTIEGGGLIEPNFRVVDSYNLIASRCYVKECLVLRVANITAEAIHIAQDTPIAFLTDGNIIDIHEPEVLDWNGTTIQNCDVTIDSEPVLPDHVKTPIRHLT